MVFNVVQKFMEIKPKNIFWLILRRLPVTSPEALWVTPRFFVKLISGGSNVGFPLITQKR